MDMVQNKRKSFAQVLGEQTPYRPAPIKPSRGFGTTDTLPKQTRIQSHVDDAHLTAMRQSRQKYTSQNAGVSNFADQYMLEDTKSQAGSAFKQTEYVIVTREDAAPPEFSLTAKR